MTAYERARRLYMERGFGEDEILKDIASVLLQGGVIYSDHDIFGMARAVSSRWNWEAVCHPEREGILTSEELTFDLDCWHITCAVGTIRSLLPRLPYRLPLISMQRKGRQKPLFIPIERLQ